MIPGHECVESRGNRMFYDATVEDPSYPGADSSMDAHGGLMPNRTNNPYKGELEVILSLAPTSDNIERLSKLLERSHSAIEIVYKIAFEHGPFGQRATVQERKIVEAKERVGIKIGRKNSR